MPRRIRARRRIRRRLDPDLLTDEPLDPLEQRALGAAHERYRGTFASRASRAANAMHVVLRHLGQLVVHDVRKLVDVQATRGEIRRDKHASMRSSSSLIEAEQLPPLLTIEEADALLADRPVPRVRAAHEYLYWGGTAGMPVIRFGPATLRVPRWALIELATTGRVVRLCDAVAHFTEGSLGR